MPERSATPQLRVTSDLRLDIDGLEARIEGDGDQVRVTTEHPTRLLGHAALLVRTLGATPARSALDRLNATGVTVTLCGPRRDLLVAGADAGKLHVRLPLPFDLRGSAAAVGFVAIAVFIIESRRRAGASARKAVS